MLRTTMAILAVLVLTSVVASACPASYVHGLGSRNTGDKKFNKASQVADGYLENRGVNPQSPAGQTIRPYVIGTGLVEDRYNRSDPFDLNNDSVDSLVQQALGPNAGQPHDGRFDSRGGHGIGGSLKNHHHFNRHFGHGVQDAEGKGEGVDPTTDRRGG